MTILLKLFLSVLTMKKATCGSHFESFHRWENLDNKTCPTSEVVVDKGAGSLVKCATLCQSSTECTSMVYFMTQKVCRGCKQRPETEPESLITAVSPSMFYSNGLKSPLTCADILLNKPDTESGVYQNKLGIELYCDMEINGGGWTVFQKRFDRSLVFNRMWDSYKSGFGNISSEFWFGLEKLRNIISEENRQFILRIDLEDTDGSTSYAVYQNFSITDENDYYRLLIGNYSGTAGDALPGYNGTMFSTDDVDNDEVLRGSCAEKGLGGWWYRSSCFGLNNQHGSDATLWWPLSYFSLQKCSMKIREY